MKFFKESGDNNIEGQRVGIPTEIRRIDPNRITPQQVRKIKDVLSRHLPILNKLLPDLIRTIIPGNSLELHKLLSQLKSFESLINNWANFNTPEGRKSVIREAKDLIGQLEKHKNTLKPEDRKAVEETIASLRDFIAELASLDSAKQAKPPIQRPLTLVTSTHANPAELASFLRPVIDSPSTTTSTMLTFICVNGLVEIKVDTSVTADQMFTVSRRPDVTVHSDSRIGRFAASLLERLISRQITQALEEIKTKQGELTPDAVIKAIEQLAGGELFRIVELVFSRASENAQNEDKLLAEAKEEERFYERVIERRLAAKARAKKAEAARALGIKINFIRNDKENTSKAEINFSFIGQLNPAKLLKMVADLCRLQDSEPSLEVVPTLFTLAAEMLQNETLPPKAKAEIIDFVSQAIIAAIENTQPRPEATRKEIVNELNKLFNQLRVAVQMLNVTVAREPLTQPIPQADEPSDFDAHHPTASIPSLQGVAASEPAVRTIIEQANDLMEKMRPFIEQGKVAAPQLEPLMAVLKQASAIITVVTDVIPNVPRITTGQPAAVATVAQPQTGKLEIPALINLLVNQVSTAASQKIAVELVTTVLAKLPQAALPILIDLQEKAIRINPEKAKIIEPLLQAIAATPVGQEYVRQAVTELSTDKLASTLTGQAAVIRATQALIKVAAQPKPANAAPVREVTPAVIIQAMVAANPQLSATPLSLETAQAFLQLTSAISSIIETKNFKKVIRARKVVTAQVRAKTARKNSRPLLPPQPADRKLVKEVQQQLAKIATLAKLNGLAIPEEITRALVTGNLNTMATITMAPHIAAREPQQLPNNSRDLANLQRLARLERQITRVSQSNRADPLTLGTELTNGAKHFDAKALIIVGIMAQQAIKAGTPLDLPSINRAVAAIDAFVNKQRELVAEHNKLLQNFEAETVDSKLLMEQFVAAAIFLYQVQKKQKARDHQALVDATEDQEPENIFTVSALAIA